jgi:xanthine/uracil permease
MDNVADNRSLGELLSELSRETATLVRQEIALGKSEVSRNLARVGRHAAMIAGGAAFSYAGLLAIVAAIVLGMVQAGVAPWLAALLTGIVIVIIGYALVQSGLTALKRDQVVPETTVETLKEDAQWAKNQVR